MESEKSSPENYLIFKKEEYYCKNLRYKITDYNSVNKITENILSIFIFSSKSDMIKMTLVFGKISELNGG